MAAASAKTENVVEKRLRALYDLQQIDSAIDNIKQVRGELPLEVEDLEDEIAGLHTRIDNMKGEVKDLEKSISDRKNIMVESKAAIEKYQEQQKNVRNNREFDTLSKEIEYQELEIQLQEKEIKKSKGDIDAKKKVLEVTEAKVAEREADLDAKRKELEEIVAETEKEESTLLAKSEKAEKIIEERLLTAYKRIRGNAKNGLAVVNVERDACGGCFSKIPPQRQMDINSNKKVIVCENCGRVLVDFLEKVIEVEEPKKKTTRRRAAKTED